MYILRCVLYYTINLVIMMTRVVGLRWDGEGGPR